MSPDLAGYIRPLRRRVRMLMAERYGLYGGSIGAVVASAIVLLSVRFVDLLDYRLWVIIVIAGLVGGILIGFLTKVGDMAIAVAADKRTGLKERISTAVSIDGSSHLGDIERALIADASRHIGGFQPREVFRHRWGRPHAAFGIALVILLCVALLPQLSLFQSKTRRQEVRVMRDEGRKMVSVAKEIRQGAGPKHQELRALAARLEKLGAQMQTGRMDKKQAMLRTRALSQQVKAEQDRLASVNSHTKSMEQAQSEMQKTGTAIARRMADDIAKAQHIPAGSAMKKLPSDKRLAELAQKSGSLSPAEQSEVEQALSKYADPGDGTPIPPELGAALAKLAANKDYRKAAEIMQKLAQKLHNGKMSNLDKKALQEQMKALAKALSNTDLDQLAKQILANSERLANMSPEELDKLLKQAQEMERMASSLKKAGGT